MKFPVLLLLILTPIVRSQTPDATSQLLTAINSASIQVQALGTLTLNNNTFTQLVQVLNGVFGSMAVTTVPYYNTQVASLTNNILKIQNSFQQLSNTANANSLMVFNLINSLGSAYTSQIWNIGNMLNNYQNSVVPQIANLGNDAAVANLELGYLLGNGTAIQSNGQSLVTGVTSAQSNQANVEGFIASLQSYDFFYVTLSLSSLTLGSTGLAYCKSYIYTFPSTYSTIPFVEPRIVFTSEPNATGPNNYDLVQTILTNTAIGLWICDRSLSSFTLHPANLIIRTYISI